MIKSASINPVSMVWQFLSSFVDLSSVRRSSCLEWMYMILAFFKVWADLHWCRMTSCKYCCWAQPLKTAALWLHMYHQYSMSFAESFSTWVLYRFLSYLALLIPERIIALRLFWLVIAFSSRLNSLNLF